MRPSKHDESGEDQRAADPSFGVDDAASRGVVIEFHGHYSAGTRSNESIVNGLSSGSVRVPPSAVSYL